MKKLLLFIALLFASPAWGQVGLTTDYGPSMLPQRTVLSTQTAAACEAFAVRTGVTNHSLTWVPSAGITGITVTWSANTTGGGSFPNILGTSTALGTTLTATGTVAAMQVCYSGISGAGTINAAYWGNSLVAAGGGSVSDPSGTAADTYVTYWRSATTLGGDSGFRYNETNTAPQVSLVETGGGTNQTWWALKADAGVFTISTLTDAGAAGTSPLTLTRTGVGVATSLAATPQAAAAASIAGSTLTLAASNATAGTSVAGAADGAAVIITAGAGARFTSGNGNGGDIFAVPGDQIGTAREGQTIFGIATTTGIYATNGPSTVNNGKALISVTGTGSGPLAPFMSFRYSDNTTTRPSGVSSYKSRATAIGTLAASASGELLTVYVGRGAGSTTVWDTTDAGIAIIASQAHTASNQGKYVQVRVTADNATAQTNAWRFAQDASFIPEADNTQAFGTSTARIATANITGITVQTVAYSSGTSGNVALKGGTPAVAGNGTLNAGSQNSSGKVTFNNTGASTITLTFSSGFTIAPACSVSNETTANLMRATSTTTTVALAGTTVTGDVASYLCIGY